MEKQKIDKKYNDLLNYYIKSAKTMYNYVRFNNSDVLFIDKESIVKNVDIDNKRDYQTVYSEFKKYAYDFVKCWEKLVNYPDFEKSFKNNNNDVSKTLSHMLINLMYIIPIKYENENIYFRMYPSTIYDNFKFFKIFNNDLCELLKIQLSKNICPTLEDLANDYAISIENMLMFLSKNNLKDTDNTIPKLLVYGEFFEAVNYKLDRDYNEICDLFDKFKKYIKPYIESYNALIGFTEFGRKFHIASKIFFNNVHILYKSVPINYWSKIPSIRDIGNCYDDFCKFNDEIISMLMKGREKE